MTIRFSDNKLNFTAETDFTIRSRIPRTVQVLLLFLAAFDVICLSAYLTDDEGMNLTLLLIIVSSIALLGYIMFFFLNRFRSLIIATEFQTAMLASAAQLGTRFCCIINREGVILYVDPGFQRVFPSFIASGCRTLEELFLFIETPTELKGRILATLKRNKADQVILSFKDGEGNLMSLVTSIDVITRPKGYFIIRGRDYVEKRSEEKDEGKLDPKEVSRLLEATLHQMPGGIIVADNKGKIVYVSRELEQWLGYNPGEILQFKIMLGQLFQQYIGHDAVMLHSDFDGKVVLKRKNTSTITMSVHQKLLGDDNQTLGISAVVSV